MDKFRILCRYCGSYEVKVVNRMCYGECEGYEIKCEKCGTSTSDLHDDPLDPIELLHRYLFKGTGEQVPRGILNSIWTVPMDCNDCLYISLTEKEQKRYGSHIDHYCNKYHERVIHGAQKVPHNPKLWPCKKCIDEQGGHKCTLEEREKFWSLGYRKAKAKIEQEKSR